MQAVEDMVIFRFHFFLIFHTHLGKLGRVCHQDLSCSRIRPQSQSQLSHFLLVWSWASYLTSLILISHVCKTGIEKRMCLTRLLGRFKEIKVRGALNTVMDTEKSGHVSFTTINVWVLNLDWLWVVCPLYISAATALAYFLFFSPVDYCIWLASLFIVSHPLNPSFILSQAFSY